ncbi:hypothetical protein DFJ58DRAFT_737017 [Suillus subalutaceus]|uniref:uncharacterized protein n=1 Tax=Suillus subalutaceus TaxID=48586 RepID=UPI001B87BB46|nr:uncharacterized protein DFJ58DRAFT_737017 [Suillus subalutaceus]KAG1830271.1 hypothetical protein DFJ58DRAFT_737017 [Suillus subalutaceus]
MPPKTKLPQAANGRFISRKSLNNLSASSSTAASAESSPLDTPETRTYELFDDDLDQEDSEYESYKVQCQLEKAEEDQESLEGAPDLDDTELPTFDSQTEAITTPFPTSQPYIPTPLLLTQPHPRTPIKAPSVPTVFTPAPVQKKMTGSNTPAWFHGKADENEQNFLWEVERYIILNDLKTEAGKVMVFSTLLSAGSVADTWWTKLDSKHKATWPDVKLAFSERWPAIIVAEKTGLDYQREILALRLTEEELGKQITVAGVPTWSHLQYCTNLQQLVEEAGTATTASLIYQVRENLPAVMKELTTPGLAEWKKFIDEITAIDTNKLREKAEAARKKKELEKVQNTCIARLENLQTDAVEVLRLQLQRTNLGSNQTNTATTNTNTHSPSNTMAPCICYVPRGSPTPRQTRQCQPLTPEERDALRKRVEEMPHHQDNAAGRAAYDEQLKQWFTMNSQDSRVTEETPFPL